MAQVASPPVRRLARAERRQQILDAATRAFARTGFAATSLDNIAAEAGVSYARTRLSETVGTDQFDEGTIPVLLRAATVDPDAFRLLFRHAAREPEFRDVIDTMRSASTDIAQRNLAERIPDGPWQQWAARLLPTVTLEAVIAWLDTGQPDPDRAADHIGRAVDAVIQSAQTA
jgi:hypothetical protein